MYNCHQCAVLQLRERALDGIVRVWQQLAVEGPAEGEEVQDLPALLLRGRAHRPARLQHPALGAALGQEHAAHQLTQGLETRQLHQHLRTHRLVSTVLC